MSITGKQIADTTISVTELVGKLAGWGQQALPVARFIAGFIPGAAPALAAIEIAAPIIAKIVAAVPQIEGAVNAARPIIDATVAAAPNVLPHLKALYAIAVNHDPARPETHMTAADVPDAVAIGYGAVVFTPGRDNAEQQREWDRAQGAS